MNTNADLTIYNKRLNPITGKTEYQRTAVYGVHWYTNQKTTVIESGLKSADEYKIRVPLESLDGYIAPQEYRALEDTAGVWTVENGDLFLRGACEKDITKPSELQGLNPGQVLSWSDNRRGISPHIRIGGGA